jgi:hypothetical protein
MLLRLHRLSRRGAAAADRGGGERQSDLAAGLLVGATFSASAAIITDSIGLNDVVDFAFGALFQGPGAVVEITFGSLPRFPEFAIVEVGYLGVFTEIDNSPIDNQTPGAVALAVAGTPML